MSWMVSANGRATFPTGRLDLGHKPNYNIHTEKYENIYNNGYSGMPYGGMYDCGYGGYDYGGYGYDNGSGGLSKGAKWGIALGSIAAIGGAVLAAFSFGGKTNNTDATAQKTKSESASAQAQQITKEDVVKIANEVIQSSKEKQKSDEIAKTKEAAREREQLLNEGITKNDDGTFSKNITNLYGKSEKHTAQTLDELRSYEASIKEDRDFCAQNSIEILPDGSFSKTIKGKDGKETTVTGSTAEEVKQLAEDIEKMTASDDNLLA